MGNSERPTEPAESLAAPRNACRDRELIRYVARHGLVTVEHIMAAMGVGQAITYRRLARCIAAGLLERRAVLCSEPSVIRATQAGIRFVGLEFPIASLSPGGVEHYLRCASVAHLLVEEFGSCVLTEREIALAEAEEGSRFASAEVGRRPGDKRLYNRADLLVQACDGRRIAVEVELSSKAPHRLRSILRGWRLASSVDQVRYYCRQGRTHRAVCSAMKAIGADKIDRIVVIEGVPE